MLVGTRWLRADTEGAELHSQGLFVGAITSTAVVFMGRGLGKGSEAWRLLVPIEIPAQSNDLSKSTTVVLDVSSLS